MPKILTIIYCLFFIHPSLVIGEELNYSKLYNDLEREVKLPLKLSSLERPSKCNPKGDKIENQGPTSLLRLFQEANKLIEKGDCKDIYSSSFLELEEAFKEIKEDQKKVAEKIGTEIRGITDFSTGFDTALAQKVIQKWGEIGKDPECSKNVKNKKVLHIFSRITSNLFFTGILVPGRVGQIATFSGLSLGATIDFIKTILDSRYDFSSPEDRLSFIELNCSFFEFENTLNALGFFEIDTQGNFKKYKILKKRISEIQDIISKLELKAWKERENFLMDKLNSSSKRLYEVLDKLFPIFSKEQDKQYPLSRRGEIIEHLFVLYKILSNSANQFDFGEKVDRELPYLVIILTKEIANNNITKKVFMNKFIHYQEFQRIFKNLTPSFHSIQGEIKDFTDQSLKNYKRSNTDFLLKKFHHLLWKIKTRELSLRNRTTSKAFLDEKDSGTIDRINILKNYELFEIQINGLKGRAFLNYILQKSRKKLKIINKLSQSFPSRTENIINKNIKEDELIKIFCADLSSFETEIKDVSVILQNGVDFLAINRRYFSPRPKKKSYLGSYSKLYKAKNFLHLNYQDSIKALRDIKNLKDFLPNVLNYKLNPNTIGHLLLDLERKKVELEQYVSIKRDICNFKK